MSAFSQQRLLDAPDNTQCHIATTGRTIRPFLKPIGAIVDECKVHASEDGLRVRAVDPANVAIVDIEAHANAFESFVVDGESDAVTTGVPLDDLRRCLSDARMGKRTDDPVELSLGDGAITAEVEREYDKSTIRRYSEFLAIDPDSVRQEPDVPDIELSWSATIDADALADAVEASGVVADHFRIEEAGGDMQITCIGDDEAEATRTEFDGVAEPIGDADGGESSAFSINYLGDITAALVEAKVDAVTVQWGREFPTFVEFERTDEDGQTVYDGTMMVAPRIRDD